MTDNTKTIEGEIVTGNDGANVPALRGATQNITDQLLSQLGARVVKQVTRTVLQQKEDVPFAVKFETAAIESVVAEEGRGGKPKMAPARVCDVVNLATGAKQIMIMNTVLEGELARTYPELSYVGKSFLMRSHFPNDANSATGKKRYKVYEIIEIDFDADAGTVEGKSVVADGSDPVNAKGNKPK